MNEYFEKKRNGWERAGRELTPAALYTALCCAFPLRAGLGSGHIIDEDDGSYLFVFQIPSDVTRAVRFDGGQEVIEILKSIAQWAELYDGTPESRKVKLRFDLADQTYRLVDLKKRKRELDDQVQKVQALMDDMESELQSLGGLEVAR